MRSRMRPIMIWCLAAILAILGLTQLLLPPTLEGRVERAMRERLSAAEYLHIDIQAWPALASLTGRLQSIHDQRFCHRRPIGELLLRVAR